MLKGKTAIVTGSTSGIGLGIARTLAESGCHILLNGFGDAADIEKERAGIEKDFGVKARYSAADMSNADQIAGMVKQAKDELGSVDILVNNAGIQHVAPVESFPAAKWDAIIAINLSSAFHAIQHALPHMREAGWGRIINIASAHGLVASSGKAAYVAAKHGIVGLTKVVGLETAEEKNITCNAICPGWVLTPLVQKQIEDRAQKNGTSVKDEEIALLSEKQPSKAFATPEEIGGLAVYLCSDSARQITGTTLSVDGGWTAQ